MKKAIVGLAAVAAVVALRPLIKRRMLQKMRDHCEQMMGQCTARSEATGHEAMGPEAMRQKMREHRGHMAAQHEERGEPVTTV